MTEAKSFELENPCSPAYQSPGYSFGTNSYRLFAVDHPQTPSFTDLLAVDQSIESAFSALTLSPDSLSLAPPRPPFYGGPSTVPASPRFESFPLPIPFGENQHYPYWACAQSSGAANAPPFLGRPSSSENQRSSFCFPDESSNGLFGSPWAQYNIDVGPDTMWVTESNPYAHIDDRDRWMNILQRQDFSAADFDYSSILHGKEQISRNSIPILPLAHQQQGNFRPSLYNPQLIPEMVRGIIVSLAKDQKWCGVLNAAVDEGLSEQQIDMILPEVLDSSSDLMRNQFGSQFVLKLFSACNEAQRDVILISLIKYPSNFINLCLNTYGARAVQKLLEKLSTQEQISLMVSALVPGVFALSTDPNGQHVIQQCFRILPSEYLKKLTIEIANNCYQIGTNKSGCCVIQACVENSIGEARKLLINEIVANAIHLSEDPYGNYVVQHLLSKVPEAMPDLMRRFRGRFVSLSCNKFASNVVEKFLVECGENYSTMIILEFLQNAPMLFLDPYGNFVVQRALSVSRGAVFYALEKLIKENAGSMQSNIYGKKILEWFQKKRENYS